MELKLSRYASFYERDGMLAIHHSISQGLVFCEKGFFGKLIPKIHSGKGLTALENEKYQELRKAKILIEADFDEDKVLNRIRERLGKVPQIRTMYLILTDRCNLGCKYCFIRDETMFDIKEQTMSAETAYKAIDLFSSELRKYPEKFETAESIIVFFGGEPLVNKEVFFQSLDYISYMKEIGGLPKSMGVFLLTNGTLIDEEIIAAMKKHGVSVSISIDGNKVVHDTNRVYKDGSGSFDDVSRVIKKLNNENIVTAHCCAVTPLNSKSIPQIMSWFIEEFNCRYCSMTILIDTHGKKELNQEYIEDVAHGLIESYKICREKGVIEDRMMRRVNTFVNKTMYFKDCDGCGGQIVVASDGQIGPCQGFIESRKYYTGNVEDLSYSPADDPTFREWHKRTPINIEHCRKCPMIGICGGGCTYSTYLRTGSIWNIDELNCRYVKIITEWLVWDLYDQAEKERIKTL